jgi:hypothetical protein
MLTFVADTGKRHGSFTEFFIPSLYFLTKPIRLSGMHLLSLS